jgi:FKBP-type peptidyl-prolyl cis-trans isomerase
MKTMKRIITLIACLILLTPGFTQINVELKNLHDSASYAIGVSVANFYRMQGIAKLNAELVARAISDALGDKGAPMDDNTINQVLNTYLNKLQQEKVNARLDSGKKFLEANKLRPEVKTTASGLQYEIITEGSGPKPGPTDMVTCHYRGTLINGFEFDSSFKRGQPATFALNRVIAGWTEGLQLMNAGSKFKFYIPHNLGYGLYDNGAIPGGSVLIFEVELISVQPAAQQ